MERRRKAQTVRSSRNGITGQMEKRIKSSSNRKGSQGNQFGKPASPYRVVGLRNRPNPKENSMSQGLVRGVDCPLTLQSSMRKHDAANRTIDRKSTRLNSSHLGISYAVFCLKKKKETALDARRSRVRS